MHSLTEMTKVTPS